MDILPLEIWLDIFMLACTDGGYTGCSLSLTSKAIRAITRTLRFHSVALVAYPARLGSFVALYAADCKPDLGQKPKVAHLHFTVPTSFRPYRFEASVANSFVIRQPFRQIPPFRRADSLSAPAASSAPSGGAERFRGITTHGDEYKAAARQLFRLLSPDLETLVIQYRTSLGIRSQDGPLKVFDDPFPSLREVTVLGLSSLRHMRVRNRERGTHRPLFPSLTHLHIVCARDGRPTYLKFWKTDAPHVTHLCVSGLALDGSCPPTIAQLAQGLGFARSVSQVPPPAEDAYASVRYLILQANRRENEQQQLVTPPSQRAFADFEQACAGIGVRVVMAAPCSVDYLRCASTVRAEWESRIIGGSGCWGELE